MSIIRWQLSCEEEFCTFNFLKAPVEALVEYQNAINKCTILTDCVYYMVFLFMLLFDVLNVSDLPRSELNKR